MIMLEIIGGLIVAGLITLGIFKYLEIVAKRQGEQK